MVQRQLDDYIFEAELLTGTSIRPIHQVVPDMRHAYLKSMYRTAQWYCEPRDILALVTDALVCHPSKVQRKKLEDAVLALKHADGTNMFRLKLSRSVVVCASTPPITQTFEVKIHSSVQLPLLLFVGDIASWSEFSIWEGAGDVSKTRMSKIEICSREGNEGGLLMLMPARLDWYDAGAMCRFRH